MTSTVESKDVTFSRLEDWNSVWDTFKAANPKATGTEILAQLDKMITEFHLEYWLRH